MKISKRIVFVLIMITASARLFAQQNAQFGQYVFNGMYINPAYSGYKEELYIQAFARAQWTGVRGAPQTLSVSADEAINDESLGIGLMVSKDKIGAQSSLNATANLAYRIKLDRTETNIFAFGLGVGVTQASLNGNLLDPIEQGDNRIPAGYVSQILPNIRAGIHYSNEKFFVGFSADNLLSKSMSRSNDYESINIKLEPHLYLTAGMAFQLNDDFVFKPTFLIKDDLHGPTSLDLNAFLLIKERLWIGGVYRTSVKMYPKKNLQVDLTNRAAAGIIAELFVKSNLRFGYGYDYSLNELGNFDYGSHEISVGYYLYTKKSRRPKCYF
ncbi:PorP/SprF family type IX secretion system membrane protein [Pedobacter endophyticus]|uniref:Type IX secretion system membrane protein PorP/SprF n=1 Tax=Pedobacter endophyticus TaxID=2789740 RepID=A0A7S9L231_9SPHI|nr:type IX secretion system membrane protein PorP/SprF [Pedobacter endophyticus]QPH41094.1 type IX secretion system membrane protein PorP/SprF [Pedobacter endophyticus]